MLIKTNFLKTWLPNEDMASPILLTKSLIRLVTVQRAISASDALLHERILEFTCECLSHLPRGSIFHLPRFLSSSEHQFKLLHSLGSNQYHRATYQEQGSNSYAQPNLVGYVGHFLDE